MPWTESVRRKEEGRGGYAQTDRRQKERARQKERERRRRRTGVQGSRKRERRGTDKPTDTQRERRERESELGKEENTRGTPCVSMPGLDSCVCLIRVCLCVRVCVCAWMCVCMCLCVCLCASERVSFSVWRVYSPSHKLAHNALA